jgi:hypothetical protein
VTVLDEPAIVPGETALLAGASLSDCLRPEEDAAWSNGSSAKLELQMTCAALRLSMLGLMVAVGCQKVAPPTNLAKVPDPIGTEMNNDQDSVAFEHALLDRLRTADRIAAAKFPNDSFDQGFGQLGLILMNANRNSYYCTPKNVVTFATTGVDGVHFSFLELKGKVNEQSPVVVTNPSDGTNFIVGENLKDFLDIGSFRGYSALGMPSKDVLEVYLGAERKAQTREDRALGFVPADNKVLSFLRDQFGLEAWTDPKERFDALQKKYLPLLDVSPEYRGFGSGAK